LLLQEERRKLDLGAKPKEKKEEMARVGSGEEKSQTQKTKQRIKVK